MGFRGTSNAALDDIFACAEYFASGGRFSFGVWAPDNVGASCGANPSRECKRELVVLRKTIVDAAGSVSRPMVSCRTQRQVRSVIFDRCGSSCLSQESA
jgi:hypothetical protein